MALGDATADDWKNWMEREDITLRARTSLDPTYTDHTLTATGGAAKRRAITTREIMRSNGAYTGREQVFLIPKANLPSGVSPRPGYLVVDADGVTHTVLGVQAGKYGQTFRCVTIIVVIDAELAWECTVTRYTTDRDEAGRPTYATPAQVWSGIACHLQPMDSRTADMLGRKIKPGEFVAILAVTLAVRAHDIVTVWDPAEPTATEADYTITGSTDPARLDEAFKLYLQQVP